MKNFIDENVIYTNPDRDTPVPSCVEAQIYIDENVIYTNPSRDTIVPSYVEAH